MHPLHGLRPAAGKLLEAAAYLIDTGHFISSVGHHKHSQYVVAHSDMPGFTERERLMIASLCRYHRKSMPGPMHHLYQSMEGDEKRTLMLAIPILRLADNLNRSHGERVEDLECRIRDSEVAIVVRSKGDIDLEQWGAERASEAFSQVYNRAVTISKAK